MVLWVASSKHVDDPATGVLASWGVWLDDSIPSGSVSVVVRLAKSTLTCGTWTGGCILRRRLVSSGCGGCGGGCSPDDAFTACRAVVAGTSGCRNWSWHSRIQSREIWASWRSWRWTGPVGSVGGDGASSIPVWGPVISLVVIACREPVHTAHGSSSALASTRSGVSSRLSIVAFPVRRHSISGDGIEEWRKPAIV